MPEVAEELHRRFITPARVLAGSLIAGAGLTVLGFLAGGSSASAAEPAPPPSPVSALVSSAASGLGDTVGAVTQAVAPALPDPVQDVVSVAAAPAADTLGEVDEQAPVSTVVDPVVSAVDDVVAAIPVAGDVLPPAPVSTVTQPVTGSVDQAVSDMVAAVDTAVAPLTPPAEQAQPLPAAPGVAGLLLAAITTSGRHGSAAVPAFLSVAGSLAFSRAAASGSSGGATLMPAGPGGGVPAPGDGLPGGGLPGDGSTGAPGGAGGPGGAAPAAAATADDFLLPASARGGLSGAAADDHVPAGPVADHDISPD